MEVTHSRRPTPQVGNREPVRTVQFGRGHLSHLLMTSGGDQVLNPSTLSQSLKGFFSRISKRVGYDQDAESVEQNSSWPRMVGNFWPSHSGAKRRECLFTYGEVENERLLEAPPTMGWCQPCSGLQAQIAPPLHPLVW